MNPNNGVRYHVNAQFHIVDKLNVMGIEINDYRISIYYDNIVLFAS